MKAYELGIERLHFRNPSTNIIFKGTIAGKNDKDRIAKSIKELRRVYPILNYILRQGKNRKLYFVRRPESKIRVVFIRRESDEQWKSVIREQIKIPFRLLEEPLVRFIFLESEERYDVIMMGHHIMGDGKSIMHIFKDFIEIYLGHADDLPVHKIRLIAGTQDLSVDYEGNALSDFFVKIFNSRWRKEKIDFLENEYERIYKNFYAKYEIDFAHGYIEGESYTKLMAACRAHEVSLNSAVVTAFMYGMQKKQYDSREELKVMVAASLGKYLKFNPERTVGNYVSSISSRFRYNFRISFWENAESIGNRLKKELGDSQKVLSTFRMMSVIDQSAFDGLYFMKYASYTNKSLKKLFKFMDIDKKEKGMETTNLGIMELKPDYPGYEFKDVVFLPPAVTVFDKVVGVATIEERLTIGISYIKNYVSEENIYEVMNEAITSLCAASGTVPGRNGMMRK